MISIMVCIAKGMNKKSSACARDEQTSCVDIARCAPRIL